MEGECELENNTIIRILTVYGNSLKKLYKIIPENCIKSVPYTKSDGLKYNLEVNINGVIFKGKDDNSSIVISSFNRNYTKEELIALQKVAIKCIIYPFGGLEIYIGLNILSSDKTEKEISSLLNKYKIQHSVKSLDSEGHIGLRISDVKDFTAPSFIEFIMELQTLTYLLDEKCH